MEADIDILRSQSGYLVDDEFKANFCKIIIEHLLRKCHCFFALDISNYFLCLNAAHTVNETS